MISSDFWFRLIDWLTCWSPERWIVRLYIYLLIFCCPPDDTFYPPPSFSDLLALDCRNTRTEGWCRSNKGPEWSIHVGCVCSQIQMIRDNSEALASWGITVLYCYAVCCVFKIVCFTAKNKRKYLVILDLLSGPHLLIPKWREWIEWILIYLFDYNPPCALYPRSSQIQTDWD